MEAANRAEGDKANLLEAEVPDLLDEDKDVHVLDKGKDIDPGELP